MATFVGVVGWFLIVCGVLVLVVPLVIRIPETGAEPARQTFWVHVRDGLGLIGLGLLTLFFPVKVHVLVFAATLIVGWFIRRTRMKPGPADTGSAKPVLPFDSGN